MNEERRSVAWERLPPSGDAALQNPYTGTSPLSVLMAGAYEAAIEAFVERKSSLFRTAGGQNNTDTWLGKHFWRGYLQELPPLAGARTASSAVYRAGSDVAKADLGSLAQRKRAVTDPRESAVQVLQGLGYCWARGVWNPPQDASQTS